jgi:hypothetical protein
MDGTLEHQDDDTCGCHMFCGADFWCVLVGLVDNYVA